MEWIAGGFIGLLIGFMFGHAAGRRRGFIFGKIIGRAEVKSEEIKKRIQADRENEA